MRIIKSAEPAAVVAEMAIIERGCEYTDVSGRTIIVYPTTGTIYVPLGADLVAFASKLCDHIGRAAEEPSTRVHATESTAFTAVFDAEPGIARLFSAPGHLILAPSPSGDPPVVTWKLKHMSSVLEAIYSVDENIEHNLAAILCDPHGVCALSGPHPAVTAADFIGSRLTTDVTVILSRSNLSPVLLNTDTYWRRQKRVIQYRAAVSVIDKRDVPSAVAVIDFDGNELPGEDYCACCTRALAGETYFVPGFLHGCINLCQLCFHYEPSITVKAAYKYILDHPPATPLLSELTNVRMFGDTILIGDKHMSANTDNLLFTPLAAAFPGRKNVTVEWWE